jgi:hypothetical protein
MNTKMLYLYHRRQKNDVSKKLQKNIRITENYQITHTTIRV